MPTPRLTVSAFRSDRSGSVAIMFSLGFTVLLVFAGLAVDTARYYDLASKIQDSLDAATLAGAKHLIDENMTNADITDLTRRNFNASVKRLGVRAKSVEKLVVAVNRKASSVESTSRVQVESLFGPIVMLPRYVSVERKSKAVYDMHKVELSLVLDITGSMNAKNKINDLKAAATSVIGELYQGAVLEDSVRIALVPYSASVNAGGLQASVRSGYGMPLDTCVLERTGPKAAKNSAPKSADGLPYVTSLPFGNYSCPPSSVLPLQGKSGQKTVEAAINSYVALGSTAGHIGTAWGWYMLSPQWSSVLPAESAPAAYTDTKVAKSVLIMTDGLFNTSYASGPTATPANQVADSYAQFRSLCDGMKSKGLTIYTVGFDLSDKSATDELEKCATAPENFFDAKTGADLKAAFKAVADKLNTLRVAS